MEDNQISIALDGMCQRLGSFVAYLVFKETQCLETLVVFECIGKGGSTSIGNLIAVQSQ